MEQAEGDDFVFHHIGRQVESIENKYKDIEFAIKHYNMSMNSFHHRINSPDFTQFDPQQPVYGYGYNPLRDLKNYLSLANGRIDNAMDAMRITERYFKNVTSAFKGYAQLMVAKKQARERVKANEMKLLKESGQDDI